MKFRYLLMAVPDELEPKVTEMIQRYIRQRPITLDSLQGPISEDDALELAEDWVEVTGNGQWSHYMLESLHSTHLHNRSDLLKLMDTVCSASGEWVTYQNLCDALFPDLDGFEAQSKKLRPVLSWLVRYTGMAFETDTAKRWPIQLEKDMSAEVGERYRYRIPMQMADWWYDIRATHALNDYALTVQLNEGGFDGSEFASKGPTDLTFLDWYEEIDQQMTADPNRYARLVGDQREWLKRTRFLYNAMAKYHAR